MVKVTIMMDELDMGIGLDEVMRGNIQKLRTRYPAGFESDRSINRG